MKKVELSLDSKVQEILSYEEGKAVFERFLPGAAKRLAGQPAALGFTARKLLGYMGGALPKEAVEALDNALQGLELYSEEPELQDTPLTSDAAQTVQEPERDAIYPGRVWRDTNGHRIQAHGGALFYEDGTYYWYGENKDRTDGKGEVWTWGIRAYRSTDLYNWEDLGLIIEPDFSDKKAPMHPSSHADRPHIAKCPATGKYVCWIKHCGEAACFTVLEANSFMGPYEVKRSHYRPFDYEVGDFDLAVDGEKAYLWMDANHKGVVTLALSRDFLEVEKELCRQYEDLHAPFCREGVAVFRHGGEWFMLTSGMTGYVPNRSESAVAKAPDEPFVSIGDPHVADESHASFNSQISQVFRLPGLEDRYIALADRWVPDYPVDGRLADILERCTAQRFDPEHYKATEEERRILMESPMLDSANTSKADYVWLPVVFEEGRPRIYWQESWRV